MPKKLLEQTLNKNKRSLVIFGMLALISGCAKKGPVVGPQFAHLSFFQDEARFVDIPLPLRAVPRILHESHDALSIVFAHELSYDDLLVWFRWEAERLSWRELTSVIGKEESLLIYEKPNKILNISLRHNKNIVITLSRKM